MTRKHPAFRQHFLSVLFSLGNIVIIIINHRFLLRVFYFRTEGTVLVSHVSLLCGVEHWIQMEENRKFIDKINLCLFFSHSRRTHKMCQINGDEMMPGRAVGFFFSAAMT